jgi:hypothetical protein
MPTAIRRLYKRLGRRGTALILLGLAKICFGLGYALDPGPSSAGLGLISKHGGTQNWSAIWLLCGVITFGCAWLRIGRDWLGFYTALIPPLVWGSVYLWSAVSGEYPRGFAIAAWYAIGHVGVILWAASVPEYSMPDHVFQKERR